MTLNNVDGSPVDGSPVDASRRQLMRRAATTALVLRNGINLILAVVALADPETSTRALGAWLLSALAVWSFYRLLTRSQHPMATIADFAFVLVMGVAIPVIDPDPQFYLSISVSHGVAGTAVTSFSVAMAPRVSFAMTVGVAVAFAWGTSAVIGWQNLGAVAPLQFFAVQWATVALLRFMLIRVASAVDRARGDRQLAQLDQQVSEAVRGYEREQLALLHDPAASTLMMVGQGTRLPPERLAAQA